MRVEFFFPGLVRTWKRTAHFKGRKITDKHQRAYQATMAAIAGAARPSGWPMNARYRVEMDIIPVDRRRFDVDNVIKQLDSLTKVLFDDDSQIDEIHARRLPPDKANPGIRVVVEPI